MKGSLFASLVAFLLCLMTAAQAGQQTPQQPELERETRSFKFSVQSQLVEVFATVTRGKQLVPNLKASDFRIIEDGTPVSIERLDNPNVPLQIVLLFDVSESIRDSLKTIKDSVTAFVNSLNREDRVMLVLFSSDIRTYPQSTDIRESILEEIKNAQAGGMTKLYDAMLLGMRYLYGKPGRKAIVCFTDGDDTAGTSSRLTVLKAAAQFGFPIYTIGAGAGLELESLKIILRNFAQTTGGRAFFIQNLSKLREAFMEVAAELHAAYVLNYYTQVPSDGRWHEFEILMVDPTYSVRARKGFFAEDTVQDHH
jgi:Ca-activated chloride channel family protein